MHHRLVLVASLLAVSLVGSPVTMADWGEQATFSAEKIDQSDIGEETPILHYENLSSPAQIGVQRAIESPDGYYSVYGREDWPDRFFYNDYTGPGRGSYIIIYEDNYYHLYTMAGGGFPYVYWLYELPFIIYGVLLSWVAYRMSQRKISTRTAALTTVPGLAFHLLGPEFDFPLVDPMQFVGLGVLAVFVAVIGLGWKSIQKTNRMGRM